MVINEKHFITFVVDGKPEGQRRPRGRIQGAYLQMYKDPKDREYERKLADSYTKESEGYKYPNVPLRACCEAIFPVPKGISKAKKQELYGTPYTNKPDMDNILKTIDGLNGIAFEDDSQITCYGSVSKRYQMQDESPGVVWTLSEV